MPKADDFQTARPFRPVREDGYPGSTALIPLGNHVRIPPPTAAQTVTLDPPKDAVALMICCISAQCTYILDGVNAASIVSTGFVLQAGVAPQTIWIRPGTKVSIGIAANATVNYQWLEAV